MNINDLNKNQIVLLTLLVSFVTSIATGIVTVTLLDQAPPAVTQTINQVVERTIERVVPDDTKVNTVVKEVPIIVTEEELIVNVINKTTPSVVKIVESKSPVNILGTGFFAFKEGVVVTRSNIVEGDFKDYEVILENGKRVKTEFLARDESNGVSLLSVNVEEIKIKSTQESEEKITPALTISREEVSIGQTVIAFGSSEANTGSTVSVGIIAGLYKDTSQRISSIKTNAANQSNIGGPLINIKGEVVGMNSGVGNSISAGVISAIIDAALK